MKEESKRREAKEKQKAQAEDEAEKEAKYKKLMKLVDSSKVCSEGWRCARLTLWEISLLIVPIPAVRDSSYTTASQEGSRA